MSAEVPQPSSRFGRLFIAFTSRDYRFVWSYFVLNYLAMSMEMLAQGWLVLVVTDSAFWVGGVAGLRGAGQVAFGLMAGVIVDRFNRRLILAIAQTLRAATFIWLGVLVFTDSVQLWHILLTALVQGMLMATVLPTGEALIYDTVGPKRLLNAIAIKHGAFGLARIPGSIVAGALIDQAGLGPCYIVIAVVLIFSPLPVLLIKTRYVRPPAYESILQNVAGGLRYVSGTSSIKSLLLFSTVVELFGFSYFVMLPVIAKNVLHVGASELGFLSAAGSIGSLFATLALASLADVRSKALLLTISAAGAGLSLFVFGFSTWYTVSLFLSGLVGACLAGYDATMGTMLQLLSADRMRGRVLGLYGLTFGFTPLGGFLSGVIATIISASFAVSTGGVVILASIFVMLTAKRSLKIADEPETQEPENP